VKHVSYKDLKAVCADLKTIYAYERKLTAYDAAYLLLAKKQCCPLATFDKDLIYAAEQEEVRVISLE
jgi:predicted nucleic acid-binding protein